MKKIISFIIFIILFTINLYTITGDNYWKNKNESSNKINNENDEIKYQLTMKWNNEYQYFDFSFEDLKNAVLEVKNKVPFNNEKKLSYYREYYDSDINKYTKNHWFMFWNKFYPEEYHSNFPRVDYMVNFFKNQARQKNWSKKELMADVISHIQAIIYQIPNYYINDWKYGSHYFGHFTPNEVALYERGDCDSKSILLTILLNRLGFDAIVFESREYLHVMVGINTKSTGRYLSHNYKKYYFLESTYPNWKIGTIPKGCNKINLWNILSLD